MPYFKGEAVSDDYLQGVLGDYRRNNAGAPADDQSILDVLEGRRQPNWGQQQQTPTQAWNVGGSVKSPWSETSGDLIKLLMDRAKQGTNIGRGDPNVRAQVDPFMAQQERASRNYLDDLAEKSGGRPYNMQGEQRMAAERLGQTAGAFESQVIGNEIGARRDEIQNALGLWGGLFSGDQSLQLQREMGYMDDAYRRQALAQSGDQFMRELALRWYGAENDAYYRGAGY